MKVLNFSSIKESGVFEKESGDVFIDHCRHGNFDKIYINIQEKKERMRISTFINDNQVNILVRYNENGFISPKGKEMKSVIIFNNGKVKFR